ncbi:hypothetical protein BTURTLESOX_1854 [bacterium endosymbiont of Bathymodiolus sp. 5 South]|nr:hypothetical protein BTURTLESOX_1854 [bacterium endosymbiont of Bathymodiolus sp. 5 South]
MGLLVVIGRVASTNNMLLAKQPLAPLMHNMTQKNNKTKERRKRGRYPFIVKI